MAKYKRTRLCGCGECRFHPISDGPCPLGNTKGARWLWASVPSEEKEIEVEELTLDPSEVEEETLEESAPV